MEDNKYIIVTGCNGAIGRKICNYMLKTYKIIGIDKDDYVESTLKDKIMYISYDLTKDIKLDITNKYIYCIIHLAAMIRVDESMIFPELYFQNNIISTINILNFMINNKIKNIIFSSTAGVYNITKNSPFIEEDTEGRKPISVYGDTKLFCENMLERMSNIYNINCTIFRFFNVGGMCDKLNPIHLIPIIINRIKENKDLYIFGNNYNTKDGTAIRDYIHIDDICKAFELVLDKYQKTKNITGEIKIYNLGTNIGYSVKEILDRILEIMNITNKKYIYIQQRLGDPEYLVADYTKIYNELGWKPTKFLEDIIKDTLAEYPN